MIKLKSILIIAMMISVLLGVAGADWIPGDGFKMHFPQLPDPEGWDVNATNTGVADDWMCSESGWVKDIHFWGSWMSDLEAPISSFTINIYSDVPKNPQDPSSHSMPGQLLKHIVATNYNYIVTVGPRTQGWLDPISGQVLFFNHQLTFQYNIILTNPNDWLYQVEGTIYWLEIIANVASPIMAQWGWKTSIDHWNDDAVYRVPTGMWIDLYDPLYTQKSLDMAFVITGEPGGFTYAPEPTVCNNQATSCPEIYTYCQDPPLQTVCPIQQTWCPANQPLGCEVTIFPQEPTWCPVEATYCPVALPTECPEELTWCPLIETFCQVGPVCMPTMYPDPTVCSIQITACPESYTQCPYPTICPEQRTLCPDSNPTVCKLTLCPKQETLCPISPICPNQPTFFPEPTFCGIMPTVCPDIPTECPTRWTYCPEWPTYCPEIETECPNGSVPTWCSLATTLCFTQPTVCPEVVTECPVQPTFCPDNLATICEMTQCPVETTICPINQTICPQTGFTICPEVVTECPSLPTLCFPEPTLCPGSDTDGDGVDDCIDNCNIHDNGPLAGTCTSGTIGAPCLTNLDCGAVGFCSKNQEDTYPGPGPVPPGNNCGDACECEGNFDFDQDQDGSDAAKFKLDFGRGPFFNPCTNAKPCKGDFNCDVDVDGSDAAIFKADFGRSPFFNPCPNCVTVPWCIYP